MINNPHVISVTFFIDPNFGRKECERKYEQMPRSQTMPTRTLEFNYDRRPHIIRLLVFGLKVTLLEEVRGEGMRIVH